MLRSERAVVQCFGRVFFTFSQPFRSPSTTAAFPAILCRCGTSFPPHPCCRPSGRHCLLGPFPQWQHIPHFSAVAELLFRRILAMGFLDGIASPVPFHNGTNSCISLPLWKEQTCSPSEGELKTWENCTPSQGGRVARLRKTVSHSLWSTFAEIPSSEGGGERPFDPAPSGWVSRARMTREASEAGRLITKSRRCRGNAVLVGTFSAGNRCRAVENYL